MAKISVVLIAGAETHADLGRASTALSLVSEAKAAGDVVELLFDGAGTEWAREMTQENSKLHPQFEAIRDKVTGACEFCANAFGVKDDLKAVGMPLISEYHGHPSLRRRAEEGYEVIAF